MGTPNAFIYNQGMKLAIGTVQFGQSYGVSNVKGRPSEQEVGEILEFAANQHIRILDTAPAYSEAESVLGEALSKNHPFQIITKTQPLRDLSTALNPSTVVLKTFEQSLKRLRVDGVAGLIVHLAEDLLGPHGDQVWATLDNIKASGRAEKIGVSCYTGREIDVIMERYPIELVQVPVNIFDQRLIKDGTLSKLADQGIEVHARSAFLQGLALMDPNNLPLKFTRAEAPLRAFCEIAADNGLRPIELALRFVQSLKEVTRIVVGVNERRELSEIIEAMGGPIPESITPSSLSTNDEAVITPSLWPPDTQEKWGFDFSRNHGSGPS